MTTWLTRVGCVRVAREQNRDFRNIGIEQKRNRGIRERKATLFGLELSQYWTFETNTNIDNLKIC